MKSGIRFYVAALAALALVAGGVLYLIAPTIEPNTVPAVLALVGLGLVAQILSHTIQHAAAGSISSIPFLAAALVAPSWITTVGVTCAAIVGEALKRREAIKTAFNISQLSLAITTSTLIFLALGGESVLHTARPELGTYAIMYASFLMVNTFAVSGAIGLSENIRILDVWKRNTLSNLPNDVLASPLPYFFAWVYVSFGSEWVGGLAIPLLGMREVFKTNRQLQQTNEELLQLMVKAIEARDPYTSGHSRRVAHYSRLIARALGLSARETDRVGRAALLHDVGKIHEIYAPILLKPGRLTPEEWRIMQTHPVKSEELVQTVSSLRDLLGPIRHHHENWDGTGYPDQIAGERIPLGARIITLADTIDAMTTDRPYRQALSADEVRSEIVRQRAVQYDPVICDAILQGSFLTSLVQGPIRAKTPAYTPRLVPRRVGETKSMGRETLLEGTRS